MKQQQFEQQFAAQWREFAKWLDQLEASPHRRHAECIDFPARYRTLCGHYAMARERRYSSSLVDQLQQLVRRGQGQLYRHRGQWLWRLARFVSHGFPAAIRRQAGPFWLACALFWLPAIVIGLATYADSDRIYMVTDRVTVAQMESMYDPDSDHPGRSEERASDSDFYMFGFYVYNNVGIGFRTFAGGILFGLGSVFFLLFNGLHIGAIAGHLTGMGYITTFWGFVAGHSALELMAICISGAAGLVLGRALLMPGPYRRLTALRLAAASAIELMLGAMLMLFMAAFVEAFWSSTSAVPAAVKYTVGIVLWLLLAGYFLFLGRRHESG